MPKARTKLTTPGVTIADFHQQLIALGPCRQGEVAKALGITAPKASGLCAHLIKMGAVKKRDDRLYEAVEDADLDGEPSPAAKTKPPAPVEAAKPAKPAKPIEATAIDADERPDNVVPPPSDAADRLLTRLAERFGINPVGVHPDNLAEGVEAQIVELVTKRIEAESAKGQMQRQVLQLIHDGLDLPAAADDTIEGLLDAHLGRLVDLSGLDEPGGVETLLDAIRGRIEAGETADQLEQLVGRQLEDLRQVVGMDDDVHYHEVVGRAVATISAQANESIDHLMMRATLGRLGRLLDMQPGANAKAIEVEVSARLNQADIERRELAQVRAALATPAAGEPIAQLHRRIEQLEAKVRRQSEGQHRLLDLLQSQARMYGEFELERIDAADAIAFAVTADLPKVG